MILVHDKNLQNHKRHQRFIQILDKVQSSPVEEGKPPSKFVSIIQGTSLIWARARFDHNKIQINKFNKLTIEIFSRMTNPIKVSKLSINMSQPNLNKEVDYT